MEKLNVVDENGNVIGEETREEIHRKGFLHREIHVWFYTPKGEIIFQHRSKEKDTFPDLLDATVGGHVEMGTDYESAALQELEEETGIRAEKDNLTFIQMMRSKTFDPVTSTTNNALRAIYAYRYEGAIEDLKIEDGKAIKFEAWPFEKLFNISEEDRKRFIPFMLSEDILGVLHKIKGLLGSDKN